MELFSFIIEMFTNRNTKNNKNKFNFINYIPHIFLIIVLIICIIFAFNYIDDIFSMFGLLNSDETTKNEDLSYETID